ncbi:hypothetical protein OG455_38570 [Kitasatospora sp. NBC_01287]|uniref:hypothetical protein n=1 Tax=Kitasatospora sp. NBC_01287 TaxID=2903573 RepID=UPI00225855B5|nr:hypothetical protein [Kitasatospora sp. NBC_01287]MCX4751341.1 hypothetical protein [Kitasatospora sp. NBC_01287]
MSTFARILCISGSFAVALLTVYSLSLTPAPAQPQALAPGQVQAADSGTAAAVAPGDSIAWD